jgi:DNA repair protein RadC
MSNLVEVSKRLTAKDKKAKPYLTDQVGVFELNWIFMQPTVTEVVNASNIAAKYIQEKIPLGRREVREEFWIVCLNRAKKVIGSTCISIGGMAATVVDPKIVFMNALKAGASAIILGHNHPSGSTNPSQQDFALTKRLKEGAAILDILILDHIIVGEGNSYYSFADEGQL